MEKLRAAIIGLGRIASLLEEDSLREKPCTHAGAISANPDCVLAGGCDIDEERRQLFAGRWGVPVYAAASEMIRSQNPQLLVIATHPDSHYEYCRLAAASGVPLVICEKPLADTLSAARKIAGFNTTIITNHERRYSADYIKAKEILASGKLGVPLSVRATLCMGKNNRLLDVLWHDGTHMADALMFLTGLRLKHRKRYGAKLTSTTGTAWLEGELIPPKIKISPNSEGRPVPTAVHVDVPAAIPAAVPAAIPVVMELGAGRDHLIFEMEFSCSAGRLRIGNGVFEVWESRECPYAEKFRSLMLTGESFTDKSLADESSGRRYNEGPTGYFTNMIADAVSCVRESGRRPVSSAEDGLAVIEYLASVKAWRQVWR